MPYTGFGIKHLGLDLTFYQATRHSVASQASSNGVAIQLIQKVLGHTDIRTTLKYADADLESTKAVFKKKSSSETRMVIAIVLNVIGFSLPKFQFSLVIPL